MEEAITLGQEDIDQLFEKGLKLLQDKEYEKAIEVYNNLLSIRLEGNIAYVSMYNLACAHSLLGKTEEAWEWLEKSVKEGYEGIEHMKKDPDLVSLRKNKKRWGSLIKFMMDREVLVPAESLAWKPPKVSLAKPLKHPVIACTPEELARLRAAWESQGPERAPLEEIVKQAQKNLEEELYFPPEPGQHANWYTCDECQILLETVSDTKHKCPKCAKLFTGWPYDNYVYGKKHYANAARMANTAWAYVLTSREEFARRAADLLRGYAQRYLNYPLTSSMEPDRNVDLREKGGWTYEFSGHILPEPLGESNWMFSALIAYDLICDSGVLSKNDKAFIKEKLFQAMLDNMLKNDMGKSNHQTWHNAAFLWAGAVMGDQSWVDRAIEEPFNGLLRQFESCILPEGFWWENSWGYHYYTLTALIYTAEGARRLGCDLYSHPLLRKMCLVPFDYVMSDGTLPRFADSRTCSPESYRYANEAAYAAYKDEQILAILPRKPSLQSILLGRKVKPGKTDITPARSKVFTQAGHVVLRTDGPGRLSACLTFGPHGGFHGHYDKLSFVFFGYGRELGLDAGMAKGTGYFIPLHNEWYRSTISHNTVMVDGKDQRPAEGKLLAFTATTSYAAVAAQCDKAYDSVSHRRLFCLTKNYLLVVDQLIPTPEKEHTYQWTYNNRAKQARCNLPAVEVALPAEGGYKHMEKVAGFAVQKERDINIIFLTEGLEVHMKMAGHVGDEVITATGPAESVLERAPLVMVRRKGKTVWFCGTLEPVPEGSEPTVKKVEITNKEKKKTITVTTEDGEDRIVFPSGSIDGSFRVLLREPDGKSKLILDAGKK